MTSSTFKSVIFFVIFLVVSTVGFASEDKELGDDKEFNAKEMILHHVKDAHGFHLWDWNGHAVSIPLPIILWTDNGLTTFMSSEFHHDDTGSAIVEKNAGKFVKFHEKIYQLDANATTVAFDEEHHPVSYTHLTLPTTPYV